MTFEIAATTDYKNDIDPPEPSLQCIAEAGFRYVHWCHDWNSDRLYSKDEMERYKRRLDELNLRVHDIHGSAGLKSVWGVTDDAVRAMGDLLVINRLEFAAQVGCEVVIMHPPVPSPKANEASFYRSLDALQPTARRLGVRIALENIPNGNFADITAALARYDGDFLGLCFDSGHGQLEPKGAMLDWLDSVKDRLIATHLHDNDGKTDQHKPIFTGVVDWVRLAQIIAASPYRRAALTDETIQAHSGLPDDAVFLQTVMSAAKRFAKMAEG